jgi:hypothetical protein
MSEYMFGVTRQKVTRKVAKQFESIARKHGFTFVEANLPEGYKAWFAGPNRGHPFDGKAQAAIESEIEAAGITVG